MKAGMSPCKDLYYLVVIAEEGSLTRASEKLYVSQPSLSFFLKELERKLGVKIFTRVKSGLIPTAAGELVLSTAKKMLADWDAALEQLRILSSAEPYVFATPAFRGTIILPSIIVDLKSAFPELNFKFEEILTKNIPGAFAEDKIQAAFMVNKKMEGEDYRNRKIVDEEIFLIGHADHPMYSEAHRTPEGLWIEPERLAGYDVIVLQSGHQLRNYNDAFFSKNNIRPRKEIETGNIVTSIKMAESGIGVTFLPSMFLHQGSGTPVSIGRDGLRWPIYLASRKGSNEQIDSVLFDSIQKAYGQIVAESRRLQQ